MRPEKQELIRMLSLSTEKELQDLYAQAYAIKKQEVGT